MLAKIIEKETRHQVQKQENVKHGKAISPIVRDASVNEILNDCHDFKIDN